ncbi:Uncharacterized beta-barrel protein YwiB, DUF1934 family [Marinilactibacillus piezotolerans]|uniref:Uncharacterized beta-barrel protein YwiB, DUF1934 family n=1 Tax=Marinilactibacillus piezotolerans TaxID=258723 RepID=A0A1I3Z8S9_9LACT|nr:DUF1934 domain-containing protein [Marinilactibacillus piezotolerans]SFK39969.1 Uncharacterized beta-barrel protein YwiB, DUF1934 family [Marinilactibacillus piezotolerans]
MPSKKLTNGMPAEVIMETSYVQNEETHHHVFEEQGRVIYMNNSYYIRYEENYPNEPAVPVTVKINPDGVVNLIRRGENKTRLTFSSDQITETQYKTPMGIMPIHIETQSLKISYYDRPFAGRIAVNYKLHFNGEVLGSYQIRLRFTT